MNDVRLSSLNLEEFKGIRKVEGGPIKLAKFNVLIGRNNSGKTSLLEAVALLPNPNEPMPFVGQTRFSYITRSHRNQNDSLVYGYSGTATLSYTIGQHSSNLVLDSTGNWRFQTRNSEDVPKNIGYNPTEDGMLSFGATPMSLSKVRAGYYHDDFNELLQTSLTNPSTWNTIVKSRAHNRVLKDVVNPSVSEKFTEVLIHGVGGAALQARKEFPDGTSTYIRLSELGSGLQRVIVPLLLFEGMSPSIILWDDIENGMHPTLLENVMKWLFKKDWQIVISTHSIDVLNCLADLNPKDAQVVILRKSPDDVLGYEILDMEQYETVIGSNQDPRQITNLLALR